MIETGPEPEVRQGVPRSILPSLQQLRAADKPIVLTVCGSAQFTISDDASYRKLVELVDWMETLLSIQEGLAQIERGEGKTLEEFKESVRQRYGIPI